MILQCCLPVCNRENVLDTDRSKIKFVISGELFIETLLIEIRGDTVSYSSYKTKENNRREQSFTNKTYTVTVQVYMLISMNIQKVRDTCGKKAIQLTC